MHPSMPNDPDNSSITELRTQNQALYRLVQEQREHISVLERASNSEPKNAWGRVFGSLAVLVLVAGLVKPLLALNGNDWIEIGEETRPFPAVAMQVSYLQGVTDTFSQVTSEGTSDFGWIQECTEGWSPQQKVAVVEQWYVRNPETRHFNASGVFAAAIGNSCSNAP